MQSQKHTAESASYFVKQAASERIHPHTFIDNTQRNYQRRGTSFLKHLPIILLIVLSTFFYTAQANRTEQNNTMADLVGTYKFTKDDGKFDDFLSAMGVGFVTRKLAATASPTIDVSVKDDGTIVLKTTTTFKTSAIEFKLGEEFEEKRMDGTTCKTVITRDGNKLVQKQSSDPPVEILREFDGNKLVTTCKCKDVVCVREYEK